MPSLPTSGDVHVNRPLTNIAIANFQEQMAFAASSAFPMVKVPKQSDSYFIWDKADIARDDAGERAPGSEAPITATRLSTDSYLCKVYASAKLVSDQERANADEPLQLDEVAAQVVTQKLMIKRERQWQNAAFKTGVWTGSTTGTDIVAANLIGATTWDVFAATDPVQDLRAQILNLEKTPGVYKKDMTLVLGPEVFSKLIDHPKFLERYEQVQAAIMNEQLLAAVLGIKRILVPTSVHNTAKEGQAASFSFIHGKSALLIATPAAPAINVPSAGYTFAWTGLVGAEGGMRVKRFRREEMESDQIEGQMAFDFKIVAPTLGVFFSNVVA